MARLTEFERAYIECAMWTEQLDGHGIKDIPADILAAMLTDCTDFSTSNMELLSQMFALGYSESNAGHDFWLTRGRHGAGFWDRGLGKLGDMLTRNAHAYGSDDAFTSWAFNLSLEN